MVRVPAYAKLNLGLRVLGRRPDGYHELRTVFQTIALHDTLRVERARGFTFALAGASKRGERGKRESGAAHEVAQTPDEVPADERNLVVRAANAFAACAGRSLSARITLRKRIPSGGGLGGGSSDAAACLVALNRLYGSPLGPEALFATAATLGSDVPFFLLGGTALGQGRGEILTPLRDFSSDAVLVVAPHFRVSTAGVFARIAGRLTPRRGQISIYRFCRQQVRGKPSLGSLSNDLQRAVAPGGRTIERLIAMLESAGASAAMSGSGSVVYGIFPGKKGALRALRTMTASPLVGRRWLGRTIGAAEYRRALFGAGVDGPRI